MTRWGQVQNTETTNTIHRTNRSNSALSIAPMFNLTTNLLCHKTSQQAATVQQLPSTELCLRIVWLSDGPAPRRWSPVKVSMELWARHMGRHCVVDKIVTFWGREFPFFSGYYYVPCFTVINKVPPFWHTGKWYCWYLLIDENFHTIIYVSCSHAMSNCTGYAYFINK